VFLGVDGDFGSTGSPVAGAVPSDEPDSGRLPVWSVGLALGATAGTL
jgi:hypothetical protein